MKEKLENIFTIVFAYGWFAVLIILPIYLIFSHFTKSNPEDYTVYASSSFDSYDEAYSYGYEEGYQDAYDEAYTEGYNDGENHAFEVLDTYDDGYHAGYQDALDYYGIVEE